MIGSSGITGNVDKEDMISSDSQIALMSRVLDFAGLRHRVIARNVANVHTPGFQRQDVDFAESFARALERGDDLAALRVDPRIVTPPGAGHRQDGNNVDIDLEMGELQKNSMLFQVFSQLMAVKLGQMRSAISGR